MTMPPRFALLTKTYQNDMAAFAQLCATVDQHMPNLAHYVLVDRVDFPLFAHFASDRRILVDCDAILPQLKQFEVMGRRLWWRIPIKLVRGWIYQQLAKIAFVASRKEDAIVLVDSDTQFIGPVREDHVFDGDRVVLFHNPGKASGGLAQSDAWHNVALESFGLPPTGYTGADYITQAVVWSPRVVRAMIERIEAVAKRGWLDALTGSFRFSEYVLYGVFCEKVAGPHQELVTPRDREICHCSWHYDLSTTAGVESFVRGRDEHHVAILLQSNLGMADDQREEIFQRLMS